jgi:hypothetical protein
MGDRTKDLAFQIKTSGLKHLLAAGDSNAAGSANFGVAAAELWLYPVDYKKYGFPPFTPVGDTSFSGTTDLTAVDVDGSIQVKYSLDKAALPEKQGVTDTYGMLYYRITYRAFGDKGSPWIIGNGIDINEVDNGPRSLGAGVLVKIGNPGPFVTKVDVQVTTP